MRRFPEVERDLVVKTVEGAELMRALDDGSSLTYVELGARTGLPELALARGVKRLTAANLLHRSADGRVSRVDRVKVSSSSSSAR